MDIKRPLDLDTFPKADSIASFEQASRLLLLSKSDLFAGFSLPERRGIVELARTRSFHKGDTLFTQGQHFRKLILLESGCVKLTLTNRHGKEVILALRKEGDAVDLPDGTPLWRHSCSAQAVTAGRALIWTAADVEGVTTKIPQLIANMYMILHRQTQELEMRYHEATSDCVSRRLACTLIRLTDQLGVAEGDGFEIRISRHELAQMSGMTLFTVSRLISRWAKMDLVVPRREALLMLDPERLDEITSIENFVENQETAAAF